MPGWAWWVWRVGGGGALPIVCTGAPAGWRCRGSGRWPGQEVAACAATAARVGMWDAEGTGGPLCCAGSPCLEACRALTKRCLCLGASQPPPYFPACAVQGLGAVLARYWAEQGAKLILSSRSLDKLQVSRCRAPRRVGRHAAGALAAVHAVYDGTERRLRTVLSWPCALVAGSNRLAAQHSPAQRSPHALPLAAVPLPSLDIRQSCPSACAPFLHESNLSLCLRSFSA